MLLPLFHTSKGTKKRKENSYEKYYHKPAVEIQVSWSETEIKQPGEIMYYLFEAFATEEYPPQQRDEKSKQDTRKFSDTL